MSRYLLLVFPVFIVFLSLCCYTPAKASHAAGGELIYEWVSDSTYRFYFKFYRDCIGANAASSADMCYHSDCHPGDDYTILLSKIAYLPGGAPNGTTVNTECPGFPSRCSSPSGTTPNYAEWWYSAVVTLPYNCDSWHFEATFSARNTIANLAGSTGTSLHVISVLNSITAPGNNSPQFSVRPISFACINQPYTYNNGVVDPDGDSLSFELVSPLDGFDCTSQPIPFEVATPSYNLTSNPFQTNNSFSLNAATGQMSFTPTMQGANVVTLKANEYRNGQLIGSVMRDIQLNIRPCTTGQPVMGIFPGTVQGAQLSNGQLSACVDHPFSFCFKLKAAAAGTIMIANDNHNIATPGSVITYTGQQTDSIYGCFSWTPGPLDTGLVVLTVTAKDSSCGAPGIIMSQTFSIPIYISPSTSILRDTTICLGQSVPLFAYGGSQFSWAALPGGSGSGSLSCTQCNNPTASPAVTTSYVVTSNLQNICGKNKDTVTVTVNQQQAPPNPIASSNSAVCIGNTLQLNTGTVAGATYEWNGPSGFHSQLQNPTISNAQLFHTGIYTVQLFMNGCRSQPAAIPVSVKPRPDVGYNPSFISICSGKPIHLEASSSFAGVTYQWTGPNGFATTDSVINIAQATQADSGMYAIFVSDGGCRSDTAFIPVYVFHTPPLPAVTTPVLYCTGDPAVPLSATGQNLTWYISPTDPSGTTITPVPNTTSPGTYTWFVASTNGFCESGRVEVDVTVHAKPVPPVLLSPATYCEGDPASPLLTTGQNVLWYTQASGGTGSAVAPTPNTNLPGVPQVWYAAQTTPEGCTSDRTPVSVTVHPRPAVPGTDTVYYCVGNPAAPLTAQGQGLKWYTAATGGAGSITAPVPATGTPGVHTWYVSQTVNGCEGLRAPLVVIVRDKIHTGISSSRNQLCVSDTLTVRDIVAPDPDNSYTWSFDGATIVSGTGNGPYILKWLVPGNKKIRLEVSNGGCMATDSLLINVLPSPANDFSIQPDACINDIVRVQAGWDVSQDIQFTWSFDGAAVFTGSGWGTYTLSWDKPGVKRLSLHTDNGFCSSGTYYDTIEIHDYPVAKIMNGQHSAICSGDTVVFSATGQSGYHYLWQPAHYFGGEDAATVTAPVTNTGTISLQVTDRWGCKAADSVYIETKPCCTVSLPDAFTPNGDGRNDMFHIITIGHHQLSTFRILNRWGQTVFETANERSGWDGTLGGVTQEMGTYFYYLKFKCADGSMTEQKGSFLLIR